MTMTGATRRWWRTVLALAGVGLFAAGVVRWLEFREAPAAVQTEVARPHEVTSSILASGFLAYESQVTLVSEVLGRVSEVLVAEGDRVTRGQVVARLDAEAVRAELDQLQAGHAQAVLAVQRQKVELESARLRLQRNDELHKLGLIEATKYDDLLAQHGIAELELRKGEKAVAQAEAQIEQVRQRLARTSIRAPIDGRVVQISIRTGETAVPSAMSIAGGTLMVIADTRRLFADVSVDEADIARVAVGQRAAVTAAASPERPLSGRVASLALVPKSGASQGPGQGQSAARSYAVRIWLDGQDEGTFHHGMSARAEIETGISRTDHPAVPVQAVFYEDSPDLPGTASASVMVVADGKAVRRPVVTGGADDVRIEIKEGLRSGEPVIVGPAQVLRRLRDGAPVRAADAWVPAASAAPQWADR